MRRTIKANFQRAFFSISDIFPHMNYKMESSRGHLRCDGGAVALGFEKPTCPWTFSLNGALSHVWDACVVPKGVNNDNRFTVTNPKTREVRVLQCFGSRNAFRRVVYWSRLRSNCVTLL